MRLYAIRMKAPVVRYNGGEKTEIPHYVVAPSTAAFGDKPHLFTETGLALYRKAWEFRDPAWLKDATVEVWESVGEEPYVKPEQATQPANPDCGQVETPQ